MQEVCLRLMGKKLLVALALEGKFASEGLQALDGDDDMLTAMAAAAKALSRPAISQLQSQSSWHELR